MISFIIAKNFNEVEDWHISVGVNILALQLSLSSTLSILCFRNIPVHSRRNISSETRVFYPFYQSPERVSPSLSKRVSYYEKDILKKRYSSEIAKNKGIKMMTEKKIAL